MAAVLRHILPGPGFERRMSVNRASNCAPLHDARFQQYRKLLN